MHGHLAHFAFNADDLPASRAFYEQLFGWDFENPYPGFFRTSSAGSAIGAVQGRRALLDVPTNGPEVTFSVDDLGRGARGGRGRRRVACVDAGDARSTASASSRSSPTRAATCSG